MQLIIKYFTQPIINLVHMPIHLRLPYQCMYMFFMSSRTTSYIVKLMVGFISYQLILSGWVNKEGYFKLEGNLVPQNCHKCSYRTVAI